MHVHGVLGLAVGAQQWQVQASCLNALELKIEEKRVPHHADEATYKSARVVPGLTVDCRRLQDGRLLAFP